MRRQHWAIFRCIVLVLFGFTIGFTFVFAVHWMRFYLFLRPCQMGSGADPLQMPEPIVVNVDTTLYSSRSTSLLQRNRGLVFAGVMTARKYIDTRAVAINQTWAKIFPGKLAFFVAENTFSSTQLPLIPLPTVDDTYPPQRKSLLMLLHMYNNYFEDFDWFVRSDDDVYIRGDKLENLLRSLDSSRPLYIGQAGLGTPEEYGSLSLNDNENYCMGGPGVILSREALRRIAPYIEKCLEEFCTTHEDVEVGRCIKKYAGITCTWAYEMQSIFYNNQSDAAAFTGDLNESAEVQRSITLHPLKQPRLLRRLHYYLRRVKVSDLRYRHMQLSRDVAYAEAELARFAANPDAGFLPDLPLSVTQWQSDTTNVAQLQPWDFLSPSILFCADGPTCPRHNVESYNKYALNDVSRQVLSIINKYARQRGRILEFQDILYAYKRVDPVHGAHYIVDLLLLYKRFKGRRLTVPVRRHAYVQQTFGLPSVIEDSEYWSIVDSPNSAKDHADELVHVILPLSGRYATFRRFIDHYTITCLDTKEIAKLMIVLFRERASDSEFSAILSDVRDLSAKYEHNTVQWVILDGAFNRAQGLATGASQFAHDALLLFTDVDVLFTREFLHRVRMNTHRGRQVFFPIVFSQYNPAPFANTSAKSSVFEYGARRGYFRHFGFGIVSIYRSDLDTVGGLNLQIQGWGLEDVDLFEKCLKANNLNVFRAPEPGAVHVYHTVVCNASLSSAQYEMCVGSQAAGYADVQTLASMLLH